MSGGGGKGGSTTQTSKVEIPDYLEEPLKRNIAKAEELATIGHTPHMGPTVAAPTDMQQAAMRNTSNAAQAYGMGGADPMSNMPQQQTFAGGVQGYSAFPLYEQALSELQARMPGQYEALTAPFLDPVSGAAPDAPYGKPEPKSSGSPFSSLFGATYNSRQARRYDNRGFNPYGEYDRRYDDRNRK